MTTERTAIAPDHAPEAPASLPIRYAGTAALTKSQNVPLRETPVAYTRRQQDERGGRGGQQRDWCELNRE
jgi:hypothetical protein